MATVEDSMPLAQVRDHLSEVVDEVRRTHRRVIVTTHGKAAVVVVSVGELESLEATLELLTDPDAMAAIRESREYPERAERLTKEQALARWATAEPRS